MSVWFTNKGKMQPLIIKYQDEQGESHTIKEIYVHSREEKTHDIPLHEIWRDNKLPGDLHGSEADIL